jgi:hypothetical protein
MHRADNLTTFMCWFSRNLRAPTSLNHQGLSRPVQGLLYLYLAILIKDQMEIRKVNAAELFDQEKKQASYCRLLMGTNKFSSCIILTHNINLSNCTLTSLLNKSWQNLSRRSCLLLCSTMWGWCTITLYPYDSELCLSYWCSKVSDRCNSVEKLEKWMNIWLLHHSNVPCHTSLTVQHFLMRTKFQPSNSHWFIQALLSVTFASSQTSRFFCPQTKFNRTWQQVSQS